VFSLIGIGDNFVLTAIIPLIIYGVGRKFFFKKPDPTAVSTPKTISMPTPDIYDKWKQRAFNVLLLIILGLIVLQIILTFSAFLGE
jgi:predicted permease